MPSSYGLPTLSEFSRKLSPALAAAKVSPLRPLLRDFHRLAKRKRYLESLREKLRSDARAYRHEILWHGRVRRHVRNALKYLEKARRAAAEPIIIRELEIDEAERILTAAENELAGFEESFYPAYIHPKLRTFREKNLNPPDLDSRIAPVIPGFGRADIDYWLIGKLDKRLSSCVTRNGRPLRSVDHDRIIKKVFEAAFSEEGHTESQIKTARLRIAKLPSELIQD